jgi:hypothetical protein
MTEAVRKAIDCIRRGNPIVCLAETYCSEIREALIRFALACVENNDMIRVRIALAEVNRLDKMHDNGLSAELPDKGALAMDSSSS